MARVVVDDVVALVSNFVVEVLGDPFRLSLSDSVRRCELDDGEDDCDQVHFLSCCFFDC